MLKFASRCAISGVFTFALMHAAFADDAALANRVAAALKAALPDFDVTVTDPLTLKMGPKDHPDFQVNLDRISQYCSQNPDDCDREVSDFVAHVVPVAKVQAAPLRAEDLRAVVRPTAYIDQLKQQLGSRDVAFVTVPLAGELSLFCYFDMPTAMRPATMKDLAPIGLQPSQAIERCKANVKAALPPLDSVIAKQPEGKGGLLNGDSYESSYLIFPGDWSTLAAKYDGHLLVAAPDASIVIYAKDDGPDALVRVSNGAKLLLAHAERPISAEVFRWTPNGWEIAVP